MTLLLHYWLESSGDPPLSRTLLFAGFILLASFDVRVGNQQTEIVFELGFANNVR